MHADCLGLQVAIQPVAKSVCSVLFVDSAALKPSSASLLADCHLAGVQLLQCQVLTGVNLCQPVCWANYQDLTALQVAIKLEHKTSKGCASGSPPHEWSVYA